MISLSHAGFYGYMSGASAEPPPEIEFYGPAKATAFPVKKYYDQWQGYINKFKKEKDNKIKMDYIITKLHDHRQKFRERQGGYSNYNEIMTTNKVLIDNCNKALVEAGYPKLVRPVKDTPPPPPPPKKPWWATIIQR